MREEMYIDIPRHKDVIRRKHPEIWRTNIWFLRHDNAQHTSQFWSRLSMKRMCQHWSFPHTLLTWLQLVSTCSLNCKQHCRDGTFVMLLTSLWMQRSWIVFDKMASRNVSITFTVAGRDYRYTRGLFWRKCKLKWLYSFLLLTNIEIFWNLLSYHILYSHRDPQKIPTHFSLLSMSPSQPLLQRTY